MWLTGNKIRESVANKSIHIDPYNEDQLNPNSYNYRLGATLLRLTDMVIDTRAKDSYETLIIPPEGLVLQPGECYLGSTQEIFGSDVFASLITGRSSIGRKFITNHVTAGLIDQGFFGVITLEITCVKPTRVYAGDKFGQIFWFATLGDPLLYRGKYQHQKNSTSSRIYYENVHWRASEKI